jgi:hypothetical protein
VESAFHSGLAQRRGECAAEGGRGREYLRQVSGKYGTARRAPVDEADIEADAEPVDESGVCRAE